MKNKLKPFFAAAKSADTGNLELTIYEDIGGGGWFDEGVTAKSVKAKLDAAGAINSISIRINSPGGDAFEGVAICNLLRAQNKPINVFVDGIAASAASIIAMAGDSITMGVNSMLMIHNAWTVCAGDAADMRKTADVLDSISASIAQTYVSRTGKSKEEIAELMNAETWLGAQDCVDQGFATAIADFGEQSDEAMALAPQFKALSKLRNVPEQLRTAPAAEAPPVAAEPSNLSLYEARLEELTRRK